MADGNKSCKLDQSERDLSYKNEFYNIWTKVEKNNYIDASFKRSCEYIKRSQINKKNDEYMETIYRETIDVIESIMEDNNFSIGKVSSLTIDKILSILNNAISENRNFTAAWQIKGTVLYKTGKYNDSIEAFDAALETISKVTFKENLSLWTRSDSLNYKYALKFKALSLFKLGWYSEGLDILNEILDIYPTDTEIQDYKDILCTLQKENILTFLDGSSVLSGETDIETNRYHCINHGFVSLQDISWNGTEPNCRVCDSTLLAVPSVKTKRYYCKSHGLIPNKKIIWKDIGPHCPECKRLLEVVNT